MIAPYFEDLAKSTPSMTFVKVDVDELDEATGKAGVEAMPTFVDGEIQEKLVGASKEKLEALVKKFSS